jgi:hypothetical protein
MDTRVHSPFWIGSFYGSGFGSIVKFDLRRRPGRRDGRRLRWESLSFQVSMNRRRVGDEGDDCHFPLAVWTDIDLEFEHTAEQGGPSQSIFGRAAFPSFLRGGISAVLGRYDFRSKLGMRCKDPVISCDVRSRRNHNRGQFFQQFVPR